jgi:hypothetical protein
VLASVSCIFLDELLHPLDILKFCLSDSFAGGASKFHQSESFPLFSACLCKIGSMTRTASSIAHPFLGSVGAYPPARRAWCLSFCGRAWLNLSFYGKSQESIKEESVKTGALRFPRSAVNNAKLTLFSCMRRKDHPYWEEHQSSIQVSPYHNVIRQQQLRLSSQKPATSVDSRVGRCTPRDEPHVCRSAYQAKGASPCKVGGSVVIPTIGTPLPFMIGTPIFFAALLLIKFGSLALYI